MWELDYKESWAPKNWCFWTVVLEKTLESPSDCKEIQPVHSKGDQSWCSLEGLMLKLKFQYFGYLMWRADSFEKTLMLGKIEGRRRRGWQKMRWLDGITDSMEVGLSRLRQLVDGQEGLACCDSWGRKESDMTEWLNWTELKFDLSKKLEHRGWLCPLVNIANIFHKLSEQQHQSLDEIYLQQELHLKHKAYHFSKNYYSLQILLSCN